MRKILLLLACLQTCLIAVENDPVKLSEIPFTEEYAQAFKGWNPPYHKSIIKIERLDESVNQLD